MRIAVAGGTGVVGVHVMAAIAAGGHGGLALARGTGVDLRSGRGLDDALAGVDAVIDVSNMATASRRRSVDYFSTSTANLLAAEIRAGVGHHVALSIVGIDRVEYGYYFGKRRQEELIVDGPVPWSILRATQFHEFAGQMLALVPGPVALIPRMRIQPVAAREVADVLAAIATGAAVGHAGELAGPREEMLGDMARRVTRFGHADLQVEGRYRCPDMSWGGLREPVGDPSTTHALRWIKV